MTQSKNLVEKNNTIDCLRGQKKTHVLFKQFLDMTSSKDFMHLTPPLPILTRKKFQLLNNVIFCLANWKILFIFFLVAFNYAVN